MPFFTNKLGLGPRVSQDFWLVNEREVVEEVEEALGDGPLLLFHDQSNGLFRAFILHDRLAIIKELEQVLIWCRQHQPNAVVENDTIKD
jgi:hypothetical protein